MRKTLDVITLLSEIYIGYVDSEIIEARYKYKKVEDKLEWRDEINFEDIAFKRTESKDETSEEAEAVEKTESENETSVEEEIESKKSEKTKTGENVGSKATQKRKRAHCLGCSLA